MMKNISKTLLVLALSISSFRASAQTAQPSPPVAPAATPSPDEIVFNQSVDLYNKKKYEESVKALDSIKKYREQNPRWYYFYGLNMARLQRNSEALDNFTQFIKKSDITTTARAQYFVGLMHFYDSDYEKALINFQLSQDLSTDPNLDRLNDIQIEKSIKFRDYYENHKKTNLMFFLGYEYNSDVIGVSQSLSDVNLSGHSLNYGTSISYRPIDKIDFVFEPALSVFDRYTLDRTFKSSSTIQADDMLQGLFSLPFIFNTGGDMQFNLSANAYNTYLPITSTKRELYISSLFFKGKLLFDINRNSTIDTSLVVASDKSTAFTSDDNNATGARNELTAGFTHYFNNEKNNSIQYSFSYMTKNAEGVDVRYQKTGAAITYITPTFWDLSSQAILGYEYYFYPDMTTPRKDSKVSFDYTLTQTLNKNSSLGYLIGGLLSNSNEDLYNYNDVRAAVFYTFNFGI
ncbi:MAG: tetratricopeptide repeat protein [Pseudobdellovibrio sp.]